MSQAKSLREFFQRAKEQCSDVTFLTDLAASARQLGQIATADDLDAIADRFLNLARDAQARVDLIDHDLAGES